jgi:Zn finger protein HypA/HybF involved in hydrogenase expression
MTEKKVLHIHKFKRLRYKSGNEILFCALPDCSQKINPALALGKRSICWRCGESFIMNDYSLRLAKPHCEACHKPKKEIEEDENDLAVVTQNNDEIIHELSLAERLTQTIQQAQEQEEDEL